jgi:hypothetical protein
MIDVRFRMPVQALGFVRWITPALAREPAGAVLDIGARWELMVDCFLIDRLDRASLTLALPAVSSG